MRYLILDIETSMRITISAIQQSLIKTSFLSFLDIFSSCLLFAKGNYYRVTITEQQKTLFFEKKTDSLRS